MATEPDQEKTPEEPQGIEDNPFRSPYRFWKLWPLLAGAMTGVGLRIVYSGDAGDIYAAMMGGFIYLAPIAVGAVTVFIAEMRARRTWAYYVSAAALANILFVIGTILVMLEGLICAVVILPLFITLGIVGGLVMGVVIRKTNRSKPTVYGIVGLPLILGAIDMGAPPDSLATVERAIVINAKPSEVWLEILDARDIQPEEVQSAWFYRIGVPVPITGVTQLTPEGPVRKVRMGKNIYFDQVITHSEENRHIRWTYRFFDDSFPPHALDEHVVLGGRYLDLRETTYTLTSLGDRTELKVTMAYRVSTPFNWYAVPVARFLMGNLEEINLGYYQRRSERSDTSQAINRK